VGVDGSQLTVTGALAMGGDFTASNGAVVNLGGRPLSAANLVVDGAATTLVNRGTLTIAQTVSASGGYAFTFGPADTAGGLFVAGPGSSATTAAVGNVRTSLFVSEGSVTLGAPLSLVVGDTINVQDGGVVNAQRNPITGMAVYVGYYGSASGSQVQNAGAVTTNSLRLGHQSQVRLVAGGSAVGVLSIAENSTLTVDRAGGDTAALTITDSSATAFNVEAGSKLAFELDGRSQAVVLKWANPAGSNHVSQLNALIAADKIHFTLTNGATYLISTDANYTYLVQPVPEPGTVLAAGFAALAAAAGVRRLRRKRRPAEVG
jgi:hypothetical protein